MIRDFFKWLFSRKSERVQLEEVPEPTRVRDMPQWRKRYTPPPQAKRKARRSNDEGLQTGIVVGMGHGNGEV